MFKKTLGVIGFKKLRSVTSVLLAICMTAVMFAGITAPVQADTSSVGKMLEMYNQSGWSGQHIEQQIASLPAGTYKLTAYYMHEGDWTMQAQTWDNPNPPQNDPNNLWRQVPGWTWIESESEYYTTITFTTTDTHTFRVRFIAPTGTSKLWIASVSLCRDGDTTNLLTNGDFSNGTSGWSFTNQASAFPNAMVKDIEDGFFDKPTEIAPPSGNMLEVYKTSSDATGPWLGQVVSNLPAGTYEFSAYFKNEGRWQIQAQTLDGGSWAQTAERTKTESEDFYYTTIRFTKTGNTNCRVRFVAPQDASNTSKLWIANASLRHISGGNWWGRCTNYLTNGDFSNGTTGWNLYTGNNGTAVNTSNFSTPVVSEIEDGFFDKPTGIEPPSGKMVEVYNESGTAGKLVEKQTAINLTTGTYKLSAYFKHEGGWTMQAALYYDNKWNVVSDTVTESEDFYHTTITFTVPKEAKFSVRFVAPGGTSKLWIADVSAYYITGGGDWLGNCTNYVINGDFTDERNNGMANWGGLVNDDAFTGNAKVKDVEDGFFDKICIKGHSLVLGENIGVNFLMDLSVLTAEEKAASYMTFSVADSEEELMAEFSDTFESNDKIGFTCPLSSLQMAKKVIPTFHYGNGKTITGTPYSINDYTSYIIDNSSSFSATYVDYATQLNNYFSSKDLTVDGTIDILDLVRAEYNSENDSVTYDSVYLLNLSKAIMGIDKYLGNVIDEPIYLPEI